VPRGAGTGYTGGAVPVRGGIVLSLERFNRIVEIDEGNLVAIVQPCVITGDLQDAVERLGLFYPPDPASLRQSTIGGNIAECAGGPRAFKYGVTRQYVLGLEAVLPTGEVIRTGGKVVKNVAGYDLTQLLIGSEGTLAIVTEATLRLVPKPTAVATLQAAFAGINAAVRAVTEIVRARVIPATIELIDRDSLAAVEAMASDASLAPAGAGAVLLIDIDGSPEQVGGDLARVEEACRRAGAEVRQATTRVEADRLWELRRQMTYALRSPDVVKLNNDIVVPKARIPELFELITELKSRYRLRIPAFGHIGDGNIHVNVMVPRGDGYAMERGQQAVAALFAGVVALEGSITGEHGIGFSKAPFLDLAVGADAIDLMRRIKSAFDPAGILNPGKIFPEEVAASKIPGY
jgi:glycolate oxidase